MQQAFSSLFIVLKAAHLYQPLANGYFRKLPKCLLYYIKMQISCGKITFFFLSCFEFQKLIVDLLPLQSQGLCTRKYFFYTSMSDRIGLCPLSWLFLLHCSCGFKCAWIDVASLEAPGKAEGISCSSAPFGRGTRVWSWWPRVPAIPDNWWKSS